MSSDVLTALSALAASGSGDSYETPTPAEFWWPLWGGYDNPWAFTRPSLVLLLSVGLIAWWLVASTRKAAIVPSKGQWITEQVYGLVRNSIAKDVIGSHDFLKFVPLLFTMFTLILVNNLFGIIPPIQYPTMSRIGFPMALTLVVYVVYHVVGFRKHGFTGYLKSMIPGGLPKAVLPFIFVLEFITYYVTRPLSLCLRLFGNMFAGHLLLLLFITAGDYMLLHGSIGMKLVSVGSYAMAFVMTAFEILVEFLQAYIFTLLTATYIASSLADEH